MSRIKEAIEILANRGLKEPPAQEALEAVYEAVESGKIERRPCQGTVQCGNGQKATILYPNSHCLKTERGEVNILKLGHREEEAAQ
jgi:hypothetical protein